MNRFRIERQSNRDGGGIGQESPSYSTSIRYDLVLYVLVLLFVAAYGLVLLSGTLVAGLGDAYVYSDLLLFLLSLAAAVAIVRFLARDKYEFFDTSVRITRKGRPPTIVPYSEISLTTRRGGGAVFGIRIKGEKKKRWVPVSRRRAGVTLYDWLQTKIAAAR